MTTRDTRIHTMAPGNLDINTMQTPYMYIHEQFGYSVVSIYRRLMTQSDASLGIYPDTFPNNIAEHFWIQGGQGTVRPWISIGRLTTGLYFYFTAFTNSKDGKFYVNTVTEEVPVEVPVEAPFAPIEFKSPLQPPDNIYTQLAAAKFLKKPDPQIPQIPATASQIQFQKNTANIMSTITITKAIKPIVTGHMNLWLSTRYSDLIQYAMDSETYEKYIVDTTVLQNE